MQTTDSLQTKKKLSTACKQKKITDRLQTKKITDRLQTKKTTDRLQTKNYRPLANKKLPTACKQKNYRPLADKKKLQTACKQTKNCRPLANKIQICLQSKHRPMQSKYRLQADKDDACKQKDTRTVMVARQPQRKKLQGWCNRRNEIGKKRRRQQEIINSFRKMHLKRCAVLPETKKNYHTNFF